MKPCDFRNIRSVIAHIFFFESSYLFVKLAHFFEVDLVLLFDGLIVACLDLAHRFLIFPADGIDLAEIEAIQLRCFRDYLLLALFFEGLHLSDDGSVCLCLFGVVGC